MISSSSPNLAVSHRLDVVSIDKYFDDFCKNSSLIIGTTGKVNVPLRHVDDVSCLGENSGNILFAQQRTAKVERNNVDCLRNRVFILRNPISIGIAQSSDSKTDVEPRLHLKPTS